MGVYLDQGILSLSSSIRVCIFLVSMYFISIVCHGWNRFFKPISMYAIMSFRFPPRYVFDCCSEWLNMYFLPSVLLRVLLILFPMLIHSAFMLYSLSCHILLQNCFVSLTSGHLYVSLHFPHQLIGINFISLFRMSCFVHCFTLSWYIFSFPSFARDFWFTCFELDYLFYLCYCFFSVPICSNMLPMTNNACLPVKFPIQDLSWCSWFVGEHRFYHRLILLLHRLNSFNSVMFFEIYTNNLFHFHFLS